jgi:hypothetical protein
LVLGAIIYLYASTPSAPTLDRETLCPSDGPRSVTVVLLDTSDSLSVLARTELKVALEDLAYKTPIHGLLELRVIPSPNPGGTIAFSKCNPGDGSNLSEITAAPQLVRRRWQAGFREPLEQALRAGFDGADAKSSPIMESIQQITAERFASDVDQLKERRLIIASDMIQNSDGYSQYKGDLSYERFQKSSAYQRLQANLYGAAVSIIYVPRSGVNINSVSHLSFWERWINASNGTLVAAKRVQGAS